MDLKPPDEALLSQLLSAGSVTMVTLAPEIPRAMELIAACRRRGVVVALGHSDATAAQADAAFVASASAVTHLFNAMAPMSARSPGLAGVALARSAVTVQLIADGIDVADEMIRLAFAAAGRRCILVGDVRSVGGSAQHAARPGEILVEVSDGVARRADGTIAGARAALPAGLACLVRSAGHLAGNFHRPPPRPLVEVVLGERVSPSGPLKAGTDDAALASGGQS